MNKEIFIYHFKNMEWYDKWLANYTKDIDLDSFFQQKSILEWINYAFTWGETPEGHNFWEERDTKWRKFVENYKFPPQPEKGINIGVEWEFWGYPSNSQFKKFHLVNEYYDGMLEKNDFLYWGATSPKEIEDFFLHCLITMKEIKKAFDAKISSKAIKVDSKSLVFNGLHIHLSTNDIDLYAFYNYINQSNIIQWFKLNELPSFRALHSHHIWGANREYNYNYKRKKRFKPLIITDIPTIEFRIFDVEDIIYRQRRRKLATFIFELYQKFKDNIELEKKEILTQYNGEDLSELAQCCKTYLGYKGKQKIINERDSFLEIQANYQKIGIYGIDSGDYDDHYLKLLN